MKPVQEEDVIDEFASYLRDNGFRVLAAGGNQAGLFSFQTKNGRRKAPDVVAFSDSILLVCEAKVRASDLFRSIAARESDYELMRYLQGSENAQKKILENAISVLRRLNPDVEMNLSVRTGLVAGTEFSKRTGEEATADIFLFEVDMVTSSVMILEPNTVDDLIVGKPD